LRAHSPIVLVVDKGSFKQEEKQLDIDSFKILDGLQRTVRLQSISKTINFCLKIFLILMSFWGGISLSFQRTSLPRCAILIPIRTYFVLFLQGLQDFGKEGLRNTLSNNGQWFEVWTGLTADEEVKKMLTLNAGHKPVKTRHWKTAFNICHQSAWNFPVKKFSCVIIST